MNRIIYLSSFQTLRTVFSFLGWIGDITGTYDLSFYFAGLFIALSGAVLVVIPMVTAFKTCKNRKFAANSKTNHAIIDVESAGKKDEGLMYSPKNVAGDFINCFDAKDKKGDIARV